MSITFLGREPALWMSLFGSFIYFISAFLLPLSPEQQGVLNAIVSSAFGLATAYFVARDGLSAALLGFIKAVLSLAIAFGLALNPDKQAIIMTLASGVVAMFVRTQMTAAVASSGAKVTPNQLR